MICCHSENTDGNKCFVPTNAWNKTCDDCPCPGEAEKYMETPEAKAIYEKSKKLIDRIVKETNDSN